MTIGDLAGDLWYNITAENLHSDPEFGAVGDISRGSCLIHVQKPINFFNTTSSKPFHINGVTEPNNGGLIIYIYIYIYIHIPPPIRGSSDLIPHIGGFMFGWMTDNTRVASYADLPTEPYVSCDWGDGSSTTDELFVMGEDNNMAENKDTERIYNLEHKYKKQGEYTIECSMQNKVSNQSLTHSVSCNNSV